MVFLQIHKGGRARETVFTGIVLTVLDRAITNCWISIKALKEKEVKTGILWGLMKASHPLLGVMRNRRGLKVGSLLYLFPEKTAVLCKELAVLKSRPNPGEQNWAQGLYNPYTSNSTYWNTNSRPGINLQLLESKQVMLPCARRKVIWVDWKIAL